METRRVVDIKVRTFNFALDVLRICKFIAENEKEFVVTKQLSRSATSVGANVREARNAESKKDFIHKISIAQKESDESLYWLELLNEIIENELPEIERLRKEAGELLLILSAIILKTKRNLDVSK
jgi:four helix bundle protein